MQYDAGVDGEYERRLRKLAQLVNTPVFCSQADGGDAAAILRAKLRKLATEGSPPLDASELRKVRRLGEGACADVELCELAVPATERFGPQLAAAPRGAGGGALVAVKWLKPAMPSYEEANILAEAALLRLLAHPSIVPAHGCYQFDAPTTSRTALVLGYAPGGTLGDRVRRGPDAYSCTDALGWLAELSRAAEYLHDAFGFRVVHRDLKPDNVLLTSDGRVWLADFGHFRVLRTEEAMSPSGVADEATPALFFPQPGTADGGAVATAGKRHPSSRCRVGSSRFMAPEDVLGQACTERADVFSFSILCWEVLCAHRAYSELYLAADQVAEVVATKGMRPAMPPAWPSELSALLAQCWAESAASRPIMAHVACALGELCARATLDPAAFAGVLAPRHSRLAVLRRKLLPAARRPPGESAVAAALSEKPH